jgi:NADH:ubiquinone oxidoreductase subunit D
VAIHHSGIEGTVTDKLTGSVIFGATIRIVGLTKSSTTNLYGKYVISPVAPKDYQVQVSAPGYATITVVHHINSGAIGVLDFAMEIL